jgi:hypothetical protein
LAGDGYRTDLSLERSIIFRTRHAEWRTDEYRLFGSGEPQRWTEEMGIARASYRRLRDLYRSALAG